MSLMFPRLARNYIKNGYFPTDEVTLGRILQHLVPAESGNFRICDPCAGEGVALAECKHHLGNHRTTAYAVEYDAERAWCCKNILDVAIHGDLQNCVVSRKAFGLLFLNPPYGDLVRETSMSAEKMMKGKQRLEKLFYQITNGYLQFGGVMVLIVPYTCIDQQFAGWIANHFTNVSAYLAPEQRFKQVVIFGVRKRVAGNSNGILMNGESLLSGERNSVKCELERIGKGELPPELPSTPVNGTYVIPAINDNNVKFAYAGLDEMQIVKMLHKKSGTLWSDFDVLYGKYDLPHRAPLKDLSPWHLALLLAAGQICAPVTSRDGRTYLVKGDTVKGKNKAIRFEEREDGSMSEVIELTDKFIPIIRAVDVTKGSPTKGEIYMIK